MAKPKITTKLDTLQIEYKPINWPQPNEYNPNRQTDYEFELLKRSIVDDGMTQPIICLPDGKIVDGEHRWRACIALEHETIPVVIVDMNEEQRRVATLRHNLARGSHDIELTAGVFKDLEKLGALDWAQSALGVTDVEINRLLNDMTPLDEWGPGPTFSEAWDYERSGSARDVSGAAQALGQLPSNPIADAWQAQQTEMVKQDIDLKKRGLVMTADQESKLRELEQKTGASTSDVVAAAVEAHVKSREKSGVEWATMTFIIPASAQTVIEAELARLMTLAPNRNPDLTLELQRGLALEYMAVLSAETPETSLTP